MVGGKRIHPAWGVPGGVLHSLGATERDKILGWIPEALESIDIALARLKPLLDSLPLEIEHLGNFPTLFLATVTPDGALEYYDGVIRIVDAEGNIIADGLDPLRYATFLGEASEEWSYVKFPTTSLSDTPAASIASGRWRVSTSPNRRERRAPTAKCGSSSSGPKAPSASRSTIIWRA